MFGSLLKMLVGGGGDDQKKSAESSGMVQPEQGGGPDNPAIGVPKEPLIGESAGPAGKQSILDNVMFALLGPPDAILTPEANARKTKKRAATTNAATNAWQNPGDAYMDPPSSSGSSFGQTLSKVMSVFR